MQLTVKNISKSFSGKQILKDLSFVVNAGQAAALIGPNGSGKTTMLRILCTLLRPDKGEINFQLDDSQIALTKFKEYFSLVGPYLQLYEELSAYENMKFVARLKSIPDPNEKIYQLLNQVGLKGRGTDHVKTYSSGMKQRLKYAFAMMSDPDVLFLDEPTSNLDKKGIEIIYAIMEEQKKEKILIFATNDEADLKIADKIVQINA
jgi:heme exporter protein A